MNLVLLELNPAGSVDHEEQGWELLMVRNVPCELCDSVIWIQKFSQAKWTIVCEWDERTYYKVISNFSMVDLKFKKIHLHFICIENTVKLSDSSTEWTGA